MLSQNHHFPIFVSCQDIQLKIACTFAIANKLFSQQRLPAILFFFVFSSFLTPESITGSYPFVSSFSFTIYDFLGLFFLQMTEANRRSRISILERLKVETQRGGEVDGGLGAMSSRCLHK